jgi:hypothetical protein
MYYGIIILFLFLNYFFPSGFVFENTINHSVFSQELHEDNFNQIQSFFFEELGSFGLPSVVSFYSIEEGSFVFLCLTTPHFEMDKKK